MIDLLRTETTSNIGMVTIDIRILIAKKLIGGLPADKAGF
jgi:hypothetical protein